MRRDLEIPLDQGRRYSWGYPACPDQSEHEKVWRLLGLESIGMTLSGGYAVMPEQSTVAIIAHHPQAVYFGMKSGFIPEGKTSDELIAGHRARRRPAARVGPGRGRRRRGPGQSRVRRRGRQLAGVLPPSRLTAGDDAGERRLGGDVAAGGRAGDGWMARRRPLASRRARGAGLGSVAITPSAAI